jgi:hypothetical protein
MTRNYVAVEAALPHRPKFRRLSIPGRAALLTVWCDAVTRTPEAIWKNRAELAEVLEVDGFDEVVISELMDRRWLDALEDGRIAVHNWDVHQVAYSKDVTRAYEAARKLDWRNRRTLPPDPSPVGEAKQGEARLGKGVPESPGRLPDLSGTRSTNGSEEPTSDGVLPVRVGLPSPEEAALIMAKIRQEQGLPVRAGAA